MEELLSYEELQERITHLEKEIADLKREKKHFHGNHQLFFEICEYSKNAIALFEAMDNGKHFIIKYFNKKAENIEKVDRNRIIGTELSAYFPSVKKSGFLKALQRVYKTGEPEEFPAILFSSNEIIEWKQNYIFKLSDNELVSIYFDETEYKTREFELNEHRVKLQLAMEAANYYSYEINLKTGKITTNKELYEALGYDGSEISSLIQKAGSLIHPEDFKKGLNLLTKNADSLSPSYKREFRIKDKKGNWVWYSANGKIVEWDKNSRPLRFIGLLKNIQEEKQMLAKLQESEEKFKSLATLLPEVVYETDVHGNIVFVNLKAFEIFGYTPEDLNKGLNIMQMLAPEELPRAQKNLEKLFNHQKIGGEEYIAVKKSGKRFPILVYSSIIKDGVNITGLRGIIINLTKLKYTQETLKTSQEIFDQLSENINDAFWLRSLDNKILYANPACYSIVGENFEKVFENFDLYEQWIHPKDRKAIVNLRQQNAKHPDKINYYEHRIIKSNGDVRWLWIRTFPVFDSRGKLYRRAGIASDITDHKNLISDLIDAKEKAEESDKLKSAFLANMSHEIRTPMNGILGFAELLKDNELTSEEKKKYLDIIDSNGKQLLNLINDIIDLAKIEANQITLNNSVIHIQSFLNKIYIQYKEEQKSLGKEHIEFELNVPVEGKAVLFTDPSRLNQILNNLLNNAFKFTQKGKISFGYEIVSEQNTQYYKFFVYDTGTGIPTNKKKYIFKRFRQLQPQKYVNLQGTGLGLAISKGLTDLLHGKIWVDSLKENIEKGIPGYSKFYFSIPVKTTHSSQIGSPEKFKIKTKMKNLEHVTILIVEDNDDNLEFLSKLLQKFGATVTAAKTGADAISAIENNPHIKIVLMDIRLPDIDGFEVTKKIKLINPKLPVIAQTAYAMYNDREICLQNGCDDYISKPLNKDILYQKINQYIYN